MNKRDLAYIKQIEDSNNEIQKKYEQAEIELDTIKEELIFYKQKVTEKANAAIHKARREIASSNKIVLPKNESPNVTISKILYSGLIEQITKSLEELEKTTSEINDMYGECQPRYKYKKGK